VLPVTGTGCVGYKHCSRHSRPTNHTCQSLLHLCTSASYTHRCAPPTQKPDTSTLWRVHVIYLTCHMMWLPFEQRIGVTM